MVLGDAPHMPDWIHTPPFGPRLPTAQPQGNSRLHELSISSVKPSCLGPAAPPGARILATVRRVGEATWQETNPR